MTDHPDGATLHLGGHAWAHPDLTDTLEPVGYTDVAHGDPTSRGPLTPYPGNPRRGDQDAITASIRDLGLYRTIIAQRSTGHVLAGNHTLRALLDLGAEQVPVTWLDVSDTRAAAIVARDNRTSELGTYDDAELLALLTADEDVLVLSGYDDDDLADVQRRLANLAFTEQAALAGADAAAAGDLSAPIDLDGDAERVTVTVDAGSRQALYTLLAKQPWVRDVADAHVRKATS